MKAADVRAGLAVTYAASVPAGQVGLWCSDSSDNTFDDFLVRDVAGPYEVDAKWFTDRGDVQVDSANNNVLETQNSITEERCIVRRGFRGGKYLATFRLKWTGTTSPGWLVRWVNPGDWLAVYIRASDGKARLVKREDDGALTIVATSTTVLSLTSTTWYNAKVLVDDDTGTPALQRLRFWVDTDGDSTFSDETTLLDSTSVDDRVSRMFHEAGTEARRRATALDRRAGSTSGGRGSIPLKSVAADARVGRRRLGNPNVQRGVGMLRLRFSAGC